MSEEKPMTVKERMAALARASSGGNSVPTPAPSRTSTPSPGTSVAERLAKMRQGGSGPGGGRSDPPPAGSPKRAGLARNVTPPSAPPALNVATQSPGGTRGPTNSGGSSVADRIARLSGSGTSSYPPSPSMGAAGTASSRLARTASGGSDGVDSSGGKSGGRPPFTPALAESPLPEPKEETASDSATGAVEIPDDSDPSNAPAPPAVMGGDSPRVSSGLAARMQAMKLSTASTGSNEDTAGAVSSKSSGTSGKVSAGLAARMQALNSEGSTGDAAAEQEDPSLPPPPPAYSSSGSNSPGARMSPGLAARMQALGDASSGSTGGKLSRENSGGAGGGTGRAQKMGGVGLPGMGMGMAIPMPGAMPPGGLAELKRRKQEAEGAASGAAEEGSARASPSEAAEEQKPGELQHANLSRATIPQRRRPRKPTRPFKPASASGNATAPTTTAAVAVPVAVAAETDSPRAQTPPGATMETPAAVEPPSLSDMKTSGTSAAAVTAASPRHEEKGRAGAETSRGSGDAVDAGGRMKSMLQAAAAEVAGGEGGHDDDDEWE